MKTFRMVVAFVVSPIVYFIGFLIGAFAGEIQAFFAVILPPMVVRSEIWATAAAIAANVASCSVFDAVYPSSPSKSRASLAWKIILLVFTVVYAILYIVYGHTQFLPYSGTSIFILIGLIIYSRKEDKNVDAPSK